MSDLEAASLVACIISAFSTIRGIIKDMADARNRRGIVIDAADESAERSFTSTLRQSEMEIGSHYNHALARLGPTAPSFQQGDGTSPQPEEVDSLLDIASASLQPIHQQMMSAVDTIQNLVNERHVDLKASDYNRWKDIGVRMSQDAVTALAQLSLRQLQTTPLRNFRPQFSIGPNPRLHQRPPFVTSLPPHNIGDGYYPPQLPQPPSILQALRSHQIGYGYQNPFPDTSGIHLQNSDDWDYDWGSDGDADDDWDADENSYSAPQVSRRRNGEVAISWTKSNADHSWPQAEESS
jgi:hypothetical protein